MTFPVIRQAAAILMILADAAPRPGGGGACDRTIVTVGARTRPVAPRG